MALKEDWYNDIPKELDFQRFSKIVKT